MAGNRPDQMGFLQHPVVSPASLLGAWDARPGYRGRWRRRVDKTQAVAGLTNWPSSKITGICSKWHFLFDFEIWHHINITGQACTELLKAEEKKRENEHLNKITDSCLEQLNMIYRLLPFSLAKKKKASQAWRDRRGG